MCGRSISMCTRARAHCAHHCQNNIAISLPRVEGKECVSMFVSSVVASLTFGFRTCHTHSRTSHEYRTDIFPAQVGRRFFVRTRPTIARLLASLRNGAGIRIACMCSFLYSVHLRARQFSVSGCRPTTTTTSTKKPDCIRKAQ